MRCGKLNDLMQRSTHFRYLTIIVFFLQYSLISKAQWEPIETYPCAVLPGNFDCYNSFAMDTVNLNSDSIMFFEDTVFLNWALGTPTKAAFDSSFGFVTDLDSAYKKNSTYLLNFKMPLTYWGNPILFFEHKFSSDSSLDGGYLEYSCNKGINWYRMQWEDLDGQLPYMLNFYNYPNADPWPISYNTTIHDTTYAFTGYDNWHWSGVQWFWAMGVLKQEPQKTVTGIGCEDLFTFNFYNDSLNVRFRFDSDTIDTQKEGWMIRNIAFGVTGIGGGVNNQKENMAFVFPNPVRDEIIFSDEYNLFTLKLVDVYGKRIEVPVKNNKANVSSLVPGIYFVTVLNDDGTTFIEKVVKE